MVARQNPSGELHEISTAWVKEYADGTIDSKASRLNFDVDDEELHGGLIKEYPMFSLEGVESRVKDGMDDMWYVGAMSDCIYIINKPARPGNDDIWHHRPDGPSMSICLPNLNAKQAQLICDLHNNKILKGLSSDELIQSLRQQLADTQRGLEAALSTEVQPEVTGAVRDRNLDGAEEFVRAIMREEPVWPNSWGQDVAFAAFVITGCGTRHYTDEAIQAAVREKLEEVLQMCIAKKEHAEKTYGVAEAVGADMCIRGVRALMESPHTSVEEPAN